jgi:hypothetical protein
LELCESEQERNWVERDKNNSPQGRGLFEPVLSEL